MKTGSWTTYRGPGRISISRSAPRRALKGYRIYKALAPGPWFKTVDKAEYERLFAEQLENLDAATVANDLLRLAGGAEPVLLCWEAPPFTDTNWCHRRLVAKWFESKGLTNEAGALIVNELTAEEIADRNPEGAPPPSKGRKNAPAKRSIAYPDQAAFAFLTETVPDGEHRSVAGSKGKFYTVCNHSGALFCDCPSFIFSTAPKTCKHLHGITAEQPPVAGAGA